MSLIQVFYLYVYFEILNQNKKQHKKNFVNKLDLDFLIKNKLKSRLIMQVHDELVIETENQELDLVKNEIKKIMESVLNLRIPLKVDIGTGNNWDEAH